MRVTFWGVRGSTPTPQASALRYGGNTPCIEIRADDRLLILDAGSGLRDLGGHLLAQEATPGLTAHILLTHYHWDHIQGLPLFEPALVAGNTLKLYGPRPDSASAPTMDDAIKLLFASPFFPGAGQALPSPYALTELAAESDHSLGNIRVRTCPTNHPQGALAYCIEFGGSSLVYAPDHEPGNVDYDRVLVALARRADLFICDAQFPPDDFPGRRAGRGHGSWQTAVELARQAEARSLVLFHHDPLHTDADLDACLQQARREFPATWSAAEGTLVELADGEARIWGRTGRGSQRIAFPAEVLVESVQEGAQAFNFAQVRDLSLHGAYFVTPQPYEVDQPLYLVIELPFDAAAAGGEGAGDPTAARHVRLRATVARVESRQTNGGGMGVGVSFSEAPSIDVLRLPAGTGNKPD